MYSMAMISKQRCAVLQWSIYERSLIKKSLRSVSLTSKVQKAVRDSMTLLRDYVHFQRSNSTSRRQCSGSVLASIHVPFLQWWIIGEGDMGRWIADHEFGYRSRTVCTIAFLIAWMRSLFFHRSKHNNCINSNNGIHCIPITRSLTVIQSLKYTTRSNRVWCRRVTTTELLRRVFQPRSTTTTVVSRQSMILLQRCSNKTILNQTYNIAASSTQLSYCDLSRRALSSLDTSSSSSSVVEQKQHQQLRKPTYHDVIYFQSILSNPHKRKKRQ